MSGYVEQVHERIFLIGYRGTGKSTISTILAARLGWDAVDADIVLEAKVGSTIQTIFQSHGEATFRDHESAVLTELAMRERIVIATGGGVVLRPENRQRVRTGFVVWLRARPETIDHRLHIDPTTAARRPNLTAMGGLAEIQTVLALREPLYAECADLILDTDDPSPEPLADAILAAWNHHSR